MCTSAYKYKYILLVHTLYLTGVYLACQAHSGVTDAVFPILNPEFETLSLFEIDARTGHADATHGSLWESSRLGGAL